MSSWRWSTLAQMIFRTRACKTRAQLGVVMKLRFSQYYDLCHSDTHTHKSLGDPAHDKKEDLKHVKRCSLVSTCTKPAYMQRASHSVLSGRQGTGKSLLDPDHGYHLALRSSSTPLRLLTGATRTRRARVREWRLTLLARPARSHLRTRRVPPPAQRARGKHLHTPCSPEKPSRATCTPCGARGTRRDCRS